MRPPWPWEAESDYPIIDEKAQSWPCESCAGEGRVAWRRCPSSVAGAWARALVSFWRRPESSRQPADGGDNGQTQFWKSVSGLIGFEVAAIEEERRKAGESA